MSKIAELTTDPRLGNPRWISTEWNKIAQAGLNQVPVVARVYLTHFWIPRRVIASRLAIRLGVGDVGSNCLLGLYADMGGTPVGGKLLVDSGNLNAGAAGVITATFTPIVIEKGIVWLAFEAQTVIMQVLRNSTTDYFTDVAGEFLRSCSYDIGAGYSPLLDPCPAVVVSTIRVIGMMKINAIV